MTGNVRRFRTKARRLMRLYSLWHKTHREEVQQKYLELLGEIMTLRPHFNLRQVFKRAF